MVNYMGMVARILGIELGESFKIIGANNEEYKNYYRFTEKNGIEASLDNIRWSKFNAEILRSLILGSAEIVRLSWKPRVREPYYIPYLTLDEKNMYEKYLWSGGKYDEELYRQGLVCKNKEGAVALTKKMLALAQGQVVE